MTGETHTRSKPTKLIRRTMIDSMLCSRAEILIPNVVINSKLFLDKINYLRRIALNETHNDIRSTTEIESVRLS